MYEPNNVPPNVEAADGVDCDAAAAAAALLLDPNGPNPLVVVLPLPNAPAPNALPVCAPNADTGAGPLPKKFVVCDDPKAAGLLLAPPNPVLPNEPNEAVEPNPPNVAPRDDELPNADELVELVDDDEPAAVDTDDTATAVSSGYAALSIRSLSEDEKSGCHILACKLVLQLLGFDTVEARMHS